MLVGMDSMMLLSKSKRVASGGVIGGEQVRRVWWNSDLTIDDAVKHYVSRMYHTSDCNSITYLLKQ